jgi:hypothetical protein
MKCRNKTLYRVVHRVNGERRPKNFSSLADAKADAKNIIKEIYAQVDSKIPNPRLRAWRQKKSGGLSRRGFRFPRDCSKSSP